MTTNASLSRACSPPRATAVARETHAHQPSSLATYHSSLITAVLIYCAAIRNAPKALKIQLDDHLRSTVKGGYRGSYEGRRAQPDEWSLITNHSSLATALLIYGSAIRKPRKPLKTQLDDYLRSPVKGGAGIF